MIRALALALLLASAAEAADRSLVGAWLKDGAPFAELKADGTGRVDHDAVRWSADGRTMTLVYDSGESESFPYALAGDSLRVTMDGETETYVRAGKAPKAAKEAKATKAAAPAKAGGDQLSKLLLSSPWCYFRYNQIAGTTKQERVVFAADGAWSSSARGETYSSGMHGTAYGQTDSGSGGRWKVSGGTLSLSEGAGPLQPVALSVTRNSNGYPILNADGKEYSQCR